MYAYMYVCTDLADGGAVSPFVPQVDAVQSRAWCTVGSARLRTLPLGVWQKHGILHMHPCMYVCMHSCDSCALLYMPPTTVWWKIIIVCTFPEWSSLQLILDNLWCAFEGEKKTLYSHASKCSCIWAINIFELDYQTFVITVASDGCGSFGVALDVCLRYVFVYVFIELCEEAFRRCWLPERVCLRWTCSGSCLWRRARPPPPRAASQTW